MISGITCFWEGHGKDIQSVKSAWSILHSELKAHLLPLLVENNKHTHTHTQPHTHTHTHTHTLGL